MIRHLEKKNWRKNVDVCWNVSEKITNCVKSSGTFQSLDNVSKSVILDSVGRGFLTAYLNNWVNNTGFNENQRNFYNSESDFWKKEGLSQLNEECNLNGLIECCKETYNLDNLKGDYEWIGGSLKK